MRIPRQPPEVGDILRDRGPEAFRALTDDEYRRFSRDVFVRYLPWDKVRRIAPQRGLDAELAWAVIAMSRNTVRQTLPFRSTRGEPLSYALPDVARRELMLIDQQLAGLITFDDDAPLSEQQRDRFIFSALMEEAIASSQLEGAATTRRVAKEMLREGRRPRTRGERMILNNYNAISFIRDHRADPLSMDLILELHEVLTEDSFDDSDQSGRFRRADENIVVADVFGETVHTPPPAGELASRIEAICAFANERGSENDAFIHPVVRAIILHFQLAYDHPFCDGNGRTARAIFYWSMLNAGYWLFEYLAISRLILAGPAKYGRAFLHTETDSFDATYFIVYHLGVIRRARVALRDYLRQSQRDAASARAMFEDDRTLNHRQLAILLHAVRHPQSAYTIESHQRSHGVAYATARSDLFDLAEKQYFGRRKDGPRYLFEPGPKLLGVTPPPARRDRDIL